ncbi:hypothetical protein H9P43_005439 [Blastocladiella emersonii ATCC 22665]|nr:hypothetical protein H9P43_005432 [Blastocladiella emersonii ATCC 22665]KAI9178777.1 hypothetical protein H9P43_005439 [Blastocladiella emersonii ATCC 22665]
MHRAEIGAPAPPPQFDAGQAVAAFRAFSDGLLKPTTRRGWQLVQFGCYLCNKDAFERLMAVTDEVRRLEDMDGRISRELWAYESSPPPLPSPSPLPAAAPAPAPAPDGAAHAPALIAGAGLQDARPRSRSHSAPMPLIGAVGFEFAHGFGPAPPPRSPAANKLKRPMFPTDSDSDSDSDKGAHDDSSACVSAAAPPVSGTLGDGPTSNSGSASALPAPPSALSAATAAAADPVPRPSSPAAGSAHSTQHIAHHAEPAAINAAEGTTTTAAAVLRCTACTVGSRGPERFFAEPHATDKCLLITTKDGIGYLAEQVARGLEQLRGVDAVDLVHFGGPLGPENATAAGTQITKAVFHKERTPLVEYVDRVAVHIEELSAKNTDYVSVHVALQALARLPMTSFIQVANLKYLLDQAHQLLRPPSGSSSTEPPAPTTPVRAPTPALALPSSYIGHRGSSVTLPVTLVVKSSYIEHHVRNGGGGLVVALAVLAAPRPSARPAAPPADGDMCNFCPALADANPNHGGPNQPQVHLAATCPILLPPRELATRIAACMNHLRVRVPSHKEVMDSRGEWLLQLLETLHYEISTITPLNSSKAVLQALEPRVATAGIAQLDPHAQPLLLGNMVKSHRAMRQAMEQLNVCTFKIFKCDLLNVYTYEMFKRDMSLMSAWPQGVAVQEQIQQQPSSSL